MSITCAHVDNDWSFAHDAINLLQSTPRRQCMTVKEKKKSQFIQRGRKAVSAFAGVPALTRVRSYLCSSDYSCLFSLELLFTHRRFSLSTSRHICRLPNGRCVWARTYKWQFCKARAKYVYILLKLVAFTATRHGWHFLTLTSECRKDYRH